MRSNKLWFYGVVSLLGASLCGTAQAQSFSVAPNIGVGIWNALGNPEAPPAGANQSSCSSSVDPYPVVLVNGTFTVMQDSFGALAPHLANDGYCVYTFNYGGSSGNLIQAIGPVPNSAQTLANFVSQVESQTGASQVDLVGYSQGGMVAEYYTKVLGGAPNVHQLIGLAPTTHGTTLDGLTRLASFLPGANQIVGSACQACTDQENGSSVITQLDSGPIAQAGVTYTIIETKNELVVTPVGSSFINEPGVTNEYVQDYCSFDFVDHVSLPYDNVAIQLLENALTPANAASPNCWTEFPYPAQ